MSILPNLKLALFFIFYSYTHLPFNSYTPASGRNWLCFFNLLLTAGIAEFAKHAVLNFIIWIIWICFEFSISDLEFISSFFFVFHPSSIISRFHFQPQLTINITYNSCYITIIRSYRQIAGEISIFFRNFLFIFTNPVKSRRRKG